MCVCSMWVLGPKFEEEKPKSAFRAPRPKRIVIPLKPKIIQIPKEIGK